MGFARGLRPQSEEDMMADLNLDLTSGLRTIFLAGVGAMATSAEKGEEVISDLVKKGELTVEQGKALNQELTVKAKAATTDASDTLLRSKLATMSADERAAYVKHVTEVADDVAAGSCKVDVEADEPSEKPAEKAE
jgi:polyhydroxyalkanoate synthesis regulator phasin